MNKNPSGFTYRYNKNELAPDCVSRQWIDAQTNLNDAVRFLIEKYSFENGIYDLSKMIPTVRDEEYFLRTNKEQPGQGINQANSVIPLSNEQRNINDSSISNKSENILDNLESTANKDIIETKPVESIQVKDGASVQNDQQVSTEVSNDNITEEEKNEVPECYQ